MAFRSDVQTNAFQRGEGVGEKVLRGKAHGQAWTGNNFPPLLECR